MASEQYLELEKRLGDGDPAAARAIVAMAEAGDADAQFTTAEFRLRGIAGSFDLDAAHELMASAAAKGHVEARRAHAYFTAAGIGCRADLTRARAMLDAIAGEDRFVADQLAFLDQMTCGERLKTAERRRISTDPHIELIRGLFSPAECRYVQVLAEPLLEPAMVYSRTGEGMRDPHRDSDNMVVKPMTEDLVIQTINRCIAEASGTGYSWGEPLHVLRYRPGQQYRPHHDANAFVAVKQRRLATALLYLNEDYEGGETAFPDLGFRLLAARGSLLIFHNLTPGKQPDPRMMHAGMPVQSGEKWVASRWIRGSDFFGRT